MPVSLNAMVWGDGPPLVILHGLFGSAGNWRSIGAALADRHKVVAYDLRNHGRSPWGDRMDYVALADDVADTMDRNGISRAAVIGHSMGGKTGMALALKHPARVTALLVADIAPVRYAHTHAGLAEAMRALDLSSVATRKEADAALREMIPEMGIRAFLLRNLVFEEGAPRWRVNLRGIIEQMPEIADFPSLKARYEGPTLFLGGANSDYVTDAASLAIRQYFPKAMVDYIPDAGHWVHAEQPKAFLARARAFFAPESPTGNHVE